MDHYSMRKALMNAIDPQKVIEDMKKYLDKPSDYTIAQTSSLVKEAILAIQVFSRRDNAEIKG